MKKNIQNQENRRFSVQSELCFCGLIIFAIIIIYGQVISHDFVSFDDQTYVAQNIHVQSGFTIEGLRWAFNFDEKEGTYWHPLTWISHMADYTLFGNESGRHLLVNMLLHALTSSLLFLLLNRITRSFWLSALTAAFFAVHPLNVETVAWISERKNILSTFLGLLTITSYVYYSRRPQLARYVLLVVLFIVCLLAKPMLVTLPFVLVLLDYWPLRRFSVQATDSAEEKLLTRQRIIHATYLLLEKIPLLCIALFSTYWVRQSLSEEFSVINYGLVPLSLRIENFLCSYVLYLYKSIWPVSLAVFYPFPKYIPFWQTIVSALLLLSVSLVILILLRKEKSLTVGWFWFIGTLFPVSGLIQVGLWPAMADRWFYVPCIGLFIIYSWCIIRFVNCFEKYRTWSFIAVIIVIIFYGSVSWNQVQYWQNSTTLFRRALQVTSNNRVAHINLGSAFAKTGTYKEAVYHFKEALAIMPTDNIARHNLIQILSKQGKFEEANQIYAEGIRLKPNAFQKKPEASPAAKNSSGNLELYTASIGNLESVNGATFMDEAKNLARLGRTEEAIQKYLRVIDVNPENVTALNDLALLFAAKGQDESAITLFDKALIVSPDNAEIHYNLAHSLAAGNRMQEAENHLGKTLELDPDFVKAHINLGILLAQRSRTDQAFSHFEAALRIDPLSVDGHTNLGVLCFQLGKQSEAYYHFQKASELDPGNERLTWLKNLVKPK